ncbi:septum formation family protein [Streptomyces sp. ISL-90]|nr:septum formation family protein [Streptomyces sp. ISL-90]
MRKDQPSLSESIVPCDQRHDDEVYAVFDLDGAEYPGETALRQTADEGCRARFADFIGIPYEESVLELYSLWPTQAAWLDGDRRVSCVVWYPDDAVVGSLAGAGY